MNAGTLHCHSCGAAVASTENACAHCGARLATLSCPSCFQLMFRDARYCPSCGSPATRWEPEPTDQLCPGCRSPLLRGRLGDVQLHECAKCFGIWLDTATFLQICEQAERRVPLPGEANAPGPAAPGATAIGPVRYVPCPHCRQLMHRVNFAKHSGVVVDVCRAHGTWFDAQELQRIVAFIRAGGLESARAREKAELAQERARLQAAQSGVASAWTGATAGSSFPTSGIPEMLGEVVGAAAEIVLSMLTHS